MHLAVSEADPAQALKISPAGEIVGAGSGRLRRRPQHRTQAHPLAGRDLAAAWVAHGDPDPRRGPPGFQESDFRRLQGQTPTRRTTLDGDDPPGDGDRADALFQDRCGDRGRAELRRRKARRDHGERETGQQQAGPPPAENPGSYRQAQDRRAQPGGRLAIQAEVTPDPGREAGRNPQRPAVALGFEPGRQTGGEPS